MRLHLNPAGDQYARKHHKETIDTKVPLADIKRHISDQNILQLLVENEYPCWGVTNAKNNSNKNSWMKMQRGDICLIYRDRHFFTAGKVLCKFNSKNFAQELWGVNDDNESWENMYLFDEVKKISIPASSFSKFMKYPSGDNFVLQRYTCYEPEISELVIEEFSLDEWDAPTVISPTNTEQDNEERIKSALDDLSETDNLSSGAKGRKEQSLLREYLFGTSKETECALCHRTFPNTLLFAAHIKPRRDCTEDERKDLNIVMPVCKIGCDDLYEKGYLLIDDEGSIVKNNLKKYTKELDDLMLDYVGKECNYHNNKTKRYFSEKYKNS